MRLPSVKTLAAITDQPLTLRSALENYRRGDTTLRATMERADELIGGYGVYYIRHQLDGCGVVYGIEYVNMGETYQATLCYDHRNDRFVVCSWGAIVETSSSYV